MTDNYSTNEITKKSSNNNYLQVSDDLSELRSLLLGVEPTQLKKIYERLDNPQITPEDVSRLLPEAVILRTMQDKQLGEAIVPTIEQAIQSSVKQDLNILSTAIFPVIGPAIRKAVSTAIDEMTQSLNQTLEHSLSPQSFKWRLEARQTGKSFAEVVMLRTLIYRVEQIFLIHKKNGLLLQHIVASQVTAQDPDLVSAMLTAIQDFVKDSFNTQKEDGLQSLKFGELTIWIETGPQAVLASIIRGTAPQELRLVFQEALEKIHLKLNRELINFEGETEPFVASKRELEACLDARYNIPTQKNYTYAWTLLCTIALGIAMWGFFAIKERILWNALVEKLDSQPGIAVIKADKRWNGKYFIFGMRDPLSVEPNILIKEANFEPKAVVNQWEPYLSFEPQLVAKRALTFLQAPKTVSFEVDNGVLYPIGSAPHKWILQARKQWRLIPGITQFQEQKLVDIELSQIKSSQNQIEKEIILFSEGTTEFLPSEEKKLQKLVTEIRKLLDTSKYIGKEVRIQIVGHTNITGTKERNIILSKGRANKILSYLESQGICTKNLSIEGTSSSQFIDTELTNEDKNYKRRVSFKVFLSDSL